jgi:hypothetical protein
MTYAVIWSENGGPEYAGRLDLGDAAMQLSGSDHGVRAQCDLSYGDVAHVFLERTAPPRHSWTPALVLVTSTGDRVEIGSLQGLGALHEVAQSVAGSCGKAAI